MVKDGILYLIDFGLSQIFVDEHNDRPQKYGETIAGTPLFISNVHLGSKPSLRDDLLSLAYVFMQLFSGSLVWNARTREFVRNGGVIYDGLININHPNNKRLYFVKRTLNLLRIRWSYRTKQSSTKISRKKILAVVKYCDYLDYSDEPDYDALIDG
jgi:hypothetical protein